MSHCAVYPPVCLSVSLSVHLRIHLSVRPSVVVCPPVRAACVRHILILSCIASQRVVTHHIVSCVRISAYLSVRPSMFIHPSSPSTHPSAAVRFPSICPSAPVAVYISIRPFIRLSNRLPNRPPIHPLGQLGPRPHIGLRRAISFRIVSNCNASYQTISFHIVSYRIATHCFGSYDILSLRL